MEDAGPIVDALDVTKAALVATATMAAAGCSSGGGGGSGTAPGYTGPIPSRPAAPIVATAESASRFLQQATFGATRDEIDTILRRGFEEWFTRQVRTRRSLHLAHMGGKDARHRVNAWWRIAVNGEDQLRQRMAWALSQIFVVSDREVGDQRGLANYYDLLAEHAFGNYRDLLEAVTLSPIMGIYLSAIRNEKPDVERNIRPDENYAREVMQLFSVGLVELNLDGSPRLQGGQPIPTYTQAEIEGMAHVFTGWNFAGLPRWWAWDPDYMSPMEAYEDFHDIGPKTILSGVQLPSNQPAYQDLTDALDTIFNHPNVGPFIAYRLIQRLVTSNPSPFYVERVATIFNNDGSGTRGNLLAVLRAVLFDREAIDGDFIDPEAFGKLKEPLLRQTALWRAFRARPDKFTRWEYSSVERDFGQAPLRSPSVFNFYPPDYAHPGPVADAGLVSPEFAILSSTFITGTTNRFFSDVFWRYRGAPRLKGDMVKINISHERTLAGSPIELVEHLDLLLMAGQMSDAMKATVTSLVVDTPFTDDGTQRVLEAIFIIVSSPEFAIQR